VNYTVLVYNESNTLVAKLEDATTPEYSRSKNSGDQVSFSFPRGGQNESEIVIGRRFEIVRYGINGNVLEASGYISEHGYSGELFEVGGFTEEIALSRYLTPSNYGYPLWSENATLDTLFDQLGRRYDTERVKQNWADYSVSETNVNYTESSQPLDFVSLSGSGTPTVYDLTGSITFRFQKSSDELWERIRWVSDYDVNDDGDGVTTKVSYQQGTTAGAGDVTAWTTPQAGALTDIVGLVVQNQEAEYMDVKVDFETTDEDVTPRLFALEVVKSLDINEIDSVSYTAAASSVATPSFSADNTSLLDLIIDVCEEAGWEFRLEQKVLEFGETLGTSRLNEYSLVEA